MNANELADGIPPALWANPKTEIHGIVDARTYPLEGFIPLCVKQDADAMLRQQQAEIEALKKEARAKDNSIAATDMMIAQFEDKFGDYEKVINGTYNKVKPHEFIAAVTGKENIVGTPMMYAEWPIRSDE